MLNLMKSNSLEESENIASLIVSHLSREGLSGEVDESILRKLWWVGLFIFLLLFDLVFVLFIFDYFFAEILILLCVISPHFHLVIFV